jgi:hypothetical protein
MTYSVVTSWLYPTESGRDICSWDFESREEALAAAEQMCKEEKKNFEKVTGCDALNPETVLEFDDEFNDCFIITPKNGLDEWFFSAEVVELAGCKLRSTKKQEED